MELESLSLLFTHISFVTSENSLHC